ncbi:hypothetical protein ES703_41639 [subsurface metagenome]
MEGQQLILSSSLHEAYSSSFCAVILVEYMRAEVKLLHSEEEYDRDMGGGGVGRYVREAITMVRSKDRARWCEEKGDYFCLTTTPLCNCCLTNGPNSLPLTKYGLLWWHYFRAIRVIRVMRVISGWEGDELRQPLTLQWQRHISGPLQPS